MQTAHLSFWHVTATNNNNNIRLLKIDKPQLDTEIRKIKDIHT